jgi:hypothetical protein
LQDGASGTTPKNLKISTNEKIRDISNTMERNRASQNFFRFWVFLLRKIDLSGKKKKNQNQLCRLCVSPSGISRGRAQAEGLSRERRNVALQKRRPTFRVEIPRSFSPALQGMPFSPREMQTKNNQVRRFSRKTQDRSRKNSHYIN